MLLYNYCRNDDCNNTFQRNQFIETRDLTSCTLMELTLNTAHVVCAKC